MHVCMCAINYICNTWPLNLAKVVLSLIFHYIVLYSCCTAGSLTVHTTSNKGLEDANNHVLCEDSDHKITVNQNISCFSNEWVIYDLSTQGYDLRRENGTGVVKYWGNRTGHRNTKIAEIHSNVYEFDPS